jgi:hypothetical protein
MASKKFHRKIQEVADQVMDDGETFRAGLAGQAGGGIAAELGANSGGAQVMRAGATIAGKMFPALVVVTDRNVYLIKTPPLKAYAVKEVVLKAPLGEATVARNGGTKVQVGDYLVSHTLRMNKEADELVAQAQV